MTQALSKIKLDRENSKEKLSFQVHNNKLILKQDASQLSSGSNSTSSLGRKISKKKH